MEGVEQDDAERQEPSHCFEPVPPDFQTQALCTQGLRVPAAAGRLLSVSQRAARLSCRHERMVIKSKSSLDTVASWGFQEGQGCFLRTWSMCQSKGREISHVKTISPSPGVGKCLRWDGMGPLSRAGAGVLASVL